MSVFDNVYKKLEEDKREKLIVICGDIFHKNSSLQTMSPNVGSILLAKFTRYVKLILIHGNHDQNMNIKDSISTIESILSLTNKLIEMNNIKYLKENKIIYLKENKIYNIDGINFGLTTMNSKEVTPIKDKKENELYIGLYHVPLYKSRLFNDSELLDENKFKVSDFKDYDITMLGDIHLHQYMNK